MPFDTSTATVTIGGIPCGEIVRGYEESIGSYGPEITKTYICNWADRYAVANGSLGLTTVTGGPGGSLQFHRPMQHPETPNCWAADIRIEGKGRPSQGAKQLQFDVALITIRFAVPQYGILPDPNGGESFDPNTSFVYATQSIEHGEESVEFPGSVLSYLHPTSGFKLSLPNRTSIPYAHAVLRITYHKLPYIPVNTLPLYNYVNKDPFLGVAKGKCKFKGSSTQREWQADGSVTQTVTNTYHYRPAWDWNFEPNPSSLLGATSDWVAIVYTKNDGDGNTVYRFPYGDLTQTFPNQSYISS